MSKIYLNIFLISVLFFVKNISSESNDFKPFGSVNQQIVDTVEGFLDPAKFVEYIRSKKPVLFKNAARNFPAFKLWDDKYFMEIDLSRYSNPFINVEQRKKENRSLITKRMNFHEFIRSYRKFDIYMVDQVPEYLMKDLFVPWSINCDFWLNHINQVLMWFSSGGTKSVVHTDDMENINCLIRGHKTFTMVDPDIYGDKIPLTASGAYSHIDVDRVDLTKYPGLDKIEYVIANMSAGDCLYVPLLWIHQVRSYHQNIAINIWFTQPQFLLETMTTQDIQNRCVDHETEDVFMTHKFLGLDTSYKSAINFIYTNLKDKSALEMQNKVMEVYPHLDEENNRKNVDSIFHDIIYEFDFNRNEVIDDEDFKLWNGDVNTIGRINHYIEYMKLMLDTAQLY